MPALRGMSSTATRAGGDDAPTGTPKTGVLMLNMGGPSSLEGERDGVGAFLRRLFEDGEIITLGRFQDSLVRRTRRVTSHAPQRPRRQPWPPSPARRMLGFGIAGEVLC